MPEIFKKDGEREKRGGTEINRYIDRERERERGGEGGGERYEEKMEFGK